MFNKREHPKQCDLSRMNRKVVDQTIEEVG